MGLMTMILGFPLAPIRGVIKLGELLQEQVERELRDPAAVRRRLEEIEQARAAGRISAEEEAEAVNRVLRGMQT
ncbi:gas vesicle protein GvpG [Thermocatellispora tengchongensis]